MSIAMSKEEPNQQMEGGRGAGDLRETPLTVGRKVLLERNLWEVAERVRRKMGVSM